MSDEELIARLHKIACHIAADRIEQLVKERDEATNQLDSARHSVDVLEKRVEALVKERDALKRLSGAQSQMLDAEEARAERLEKALHWYSEDPSSQGDVARAALKGDKP